MNKTAFIPIRGAENKILSMPYQDGYLYFTTDTRKIYFDTNNNNKMPISAGCNIYYGHKEISSAEANEDNIYFSIEDIESDTCPNENDLILNMTDGCFYKVTTILSSEQFIGFRLTVAGSGGGANGYAQAMTVKISGIDDNISFIYGQENYMTVTPMSAMDKDDNPADNYLTLRWTVRSKDDSSLSSNGSIDVTHNTPIQFEFGSKLYEGYNYVEFILEGPNSGTMRSAMVKTVVCVKMALKMHTNFTPTILYSGNNMIMTCTVEGTNVAKILEYWFDGTRIYTERITAQDNALTHSYRITKDSGLLTHGAHSVEFQLYQQLSDGSKGAAVDPLAFEIAYNSGESTESIIWLGEYQNLYNNYDKITIPYLVYNPNSQQSVVHFFKDGNEFSSSEVEFSSNTTRFYNLEITDATAPPQDRIGETIRNDYQITSNGASRDIVFYVLQTGKMILAQQDNLLLNFSAAGRSNNESSVTKSVWSYDNGNTIFNGIFRDFNWYNNGWIIDSDGNTCLRISNGASFEIPIGAITFNGSQQGQISQTFEFQFKIRNVQNYEHLIKLITRYENDESYYDAYLEVKNNWDSYDQFLNYYLPTIGRSYDDLTYSFVQSEVSTDTALCNYYDNNNAVGFCLGTQDAFFKTNIDTLNVNYVEDRIVNLDLVFSKDEKLVSIYLNGVLSGAAYVSDSSSFTVNKASIVFNSDYCDVDLYKFRIYNNSFSISEVLNNYAVDLRDTEMYAQSTALSKYNETIGEYQLDFQSMLTYNTEHPDDYLMPYIIFSDVESDALPYSKADAKSSTFQYVNTGLDRAYATGELSTLADEYHPGSYVVAWIREKDLNDILAAGTTSTKYYFVDSNKNQCYFDKAEILDNEAFAFKMKKTSATKTVEVIDEHGNPVYEQDGVTPQTEEVPDEDKSYEIPVYRYLNKVENYYLHHGASFIAKGTEIKVQGTSSQFYPRRNYKAKCKGKMYANAGPFANDPMYMEYFYMDNDNVGTTKFTLKIDYMESSGSYNTGLANLVQNAYTKHPLEDYADVIDLPDISQHRTSVQGFPALAFHKKADGTLYIGRYNMNLDKGSDECYGYKLFENNDPILGKKLTTSAVLKSGKAQGVAKIAECWEFSDNNRGFCSFRDPLGRAITTIGDNPGDFFNIGTLNANGSCPVVADSFEYRYNTDGDLLDYLYNPADPGLDIDGLKKDYGLTDDDLTNQTWRNNYLFDKMKNWEKLCKWVWSTSTNEVDSEEELYKVYAHNINKYYVGTTETHTYSNNRLTAYDALVFSSIEDPDPRADGKGIKETITLTQEEALDALETYGITEIDLATEIFGTKDEENSTSTKTVYIYTIDDIFRAYATMTGYEYVSYTQQVEQGTENVVNVGTYLGGDIVNRAEVQQAMQQSPTTYETDKSKALAEPYSAGGNTYYFDTKEYRLAKFKTEFTNHFDKEYALVYFIITEVFMCYDSRGKNCMMASWGPQVPGGEYIWYPVFYDLDTQLGINNTGIPSFEYYVNASTDGCYSTNDSVLWGNIYQCFFDDIKSKYQALRTSIKRSNDINTAPLAGIEYFGQNPVEHIENWYNCNPISCNSMNMRGKRPLIAINFDEYYKYISIMNPLGPGYQGMDGTPKRDSGGSFLYALQGDRSLSRQQFLIRRINFIDSWLTQGNYKEGTGTTIKFRTSANDPANTSDVWIDNTTNVNSSGQTVENLQVNAGYYGITYKLTEVDGQNIYLGNDGTKLDGTTVYRLVNGDWETDIENVVVTNVDANTKTISREVKDVNGDLYKLHELDADFFVKLSPYQRSYVTLATDNAPLPSIEYEGTPVRMEFPSNVVTGVRKSPQYAEQLLYLYGADYLKDIGDVSLLYPREFELTNATHLQRIILGNDTENYINKKLKSPKFDAAASIAGTGGKPLLKEAVFTNVQIDGQTTVPLDFSSSEKLNIFRALGMNLSAVSFANGVALHTLHLPSTITQLTLKEARNLSDGLITSYVNPVKDAEGNWQAQRGLYIKDFTDKEIGNNDLKSNINRLEIVGGNLGYDSYTILKKLVAIRDNEVGTHSRLSVSLVNVNWTPFSKLEKGYQYDESKASVYYIDNEHYQLVPYTYTTESDWLTNIKNGMLYIKNEDLAEECIDDITSLDLLVQIAEDINNQYYSTDETNNEIPRITGNIYVNNDTAIDESYIKNTFLDQWYPDLNIFVAEVNKAYSAKFVRIEDDDSLTVIGTQKVDPSDTSIEWFSDPYSTYASLTRKDNYDFLGWATKDGDNFTTLGQAIYSQDGTYYIYDTATNTYVQNIDAYDSNMIYYDRYHNPIVLVVDENYLWSEQQFTENVFEYTFYIRYRKHPYHFRFLNTDNSVVTQYDIPYGEYLYDPGVMANSPYELNLELYQGYTFLGWATTNNATEIEDLTQIKSIKNLDLYAVYKLVDDVHVNVLGTKYLDITDNGLLFINNIPGTNTKYQLSGKIVLPNTLKGIEVTGISTNGFINQYNITHIFLENKYTSRLRIIENNAFSANIPNRSQLVYFEMPVIPDDEVNENDLGGANGKVSVGNQAFRYCDNFFRGISVDKTKEFFNAIGRIQNGAFSYVSHGFTAGVYITSTMKQIGQTAFYDIEDLVNIYFGSEQKPIDLNKVLFKSSSTGNTANNVFSHTTPDHFHIENLYIYTINDQSSWETVISNSFGLLEQTYSVHFYQLTQ